MRGSQEPRLGHVYLELYMLEGISLYSICSVAWNWRNLYCNGNIKGWRTTLIAQKKNCQCRDVCHVSYVTKLAAVEYKDFPSKKEYRRTIVNIYLIASFIETSHPWPITVVPSQRR